jgi:hypothetical protein
MGYGGVYCGASSQPFPEKMNQDMHYIIVWILLCMGDNESVNDLRLSNYFKNIITAHIYRSSLHAMNSLYHRPTYHYLTKIRYIITFGS